MHKLKSCYSPFVLLIVLLVVFNISCKNDDNNNHPTPDNPDLNEPPPKTLSYSILKAFPHDTSSFTEGFEFYKGELYESTGNRGESKLMKINLATGKPLKQIDLDKKYFGEGITILNDTIYQLTYQEKTAFAYSVKDFKKLKEFSFTTDTKEGWGMTNDGKNLIATDGGSNLYFFNPANFSLIKKLTVTDGGSLTFNLNEVEYVEGYIYSNQWNYNTIFKIDAATGKVVAKADMTDLVNQARAKNPAIDSFNGIAYDKTTKKLYVTGKYWTEIYEIQFSQ